MAKLKPTYNEDSIEHYKGLDGIRKRPGMYLGEQGPEMVFRMLKEIVDNAADEALAGRNDCIEVVADTKTNTYLVADKAHGIPVGIHKTAKIPTITLIFTEVHAGGKFSDRSYKKGAAGTHGTGSSAVNACSDVFEVWTFRDKICYHQSFKKGKIATALKKNAKIPSDVVKSLSYKPTNGTIIRFVPDQTVVSESKKLPAKLSTKQTAAWLSNIALLNKGLKITFSYSGKTKVYLNKTGPLKIIKDRIKKEDLTTLGKPLLFEDDKMTIAVQWTSYTEEDGVRSYVSSSYTRDGGTHLDGFYNAMAKAIAKYKNKRDKFTPRDIRNGLVGVFNWRMSEPAFSSQVKDRLTSHVSKEVEARCVQFFDAFFLKHKSLARKVIRRAVDVKKSKEEFKKTMSGIAKLKQSSKFKLPDALTVARNCKPTERELFLVEGESAGGCWLGSTKVQLLNGEVKTFKQMVRDHAKGQDHYGYAHFNKDNSIHVIKFDTPRLTKYVTEAIEVTLDNGEKLKCTTDHPWKMRDGTYVPAEELEAGDSLMPHYERLTEKGRRQVWMLSTYKGNKTNVRGKWKYVHSMVVDDFKHLRKDKKRLESKGIKINVHHKDLDVWDDRPDNLEVMDERQHRALHARLTSAHARESFGQEHADRMKTDRKYKRKVVERNKKFANEYWHGKDGKKHRAEASIRNMEVMKDPNARKKISDSLKAYCSNPKWRKKRSKNQSRISNDPIFKKKRAKALKQTYKLKFLDLCVRLPKLNWKYYDKEVVKHLKETGEGRFFKFTYWTKLFKTFEAFEKAVSEHRKSEQEKYHNHKVVAVRRIRFKKPQPVYDATVPKYHNYALAAGVYVHNTAKRARDTKFQEVHQLQGKIANAMKMPLAKLLKSNAVRDIFLSLGYDPRKEDPDSSLRVGKIFLLADADEDGLHINVLLLTLLFKLMPKLFTEGRVYVCNAPLFSAYVRGKRYFGATHQECYKQCPKGTPKHAVTRAKGWGELAPDTLEIIAFNPKSRTVIKLKPIKGKDAEYFRTIMGSDTAARKQLLGLDI